MIFDDHISGLEMCSLEILVGKDGRECIIEVNDSALTLMGDTQEEDRRHIAEITVQHMQVQTRLFNRLARIIASIRFENVTELTSFVCFCLHSFVHSLSRVGVVSLGVD